jgi:nucleotidyltransferase/DNA polymerase involved in DNA repair
MKIERLREEIQKGIDAADRGECVDGRAFMKALINRASSRSDRNRQTGVTRREEENEKENEL